MPQNRTRKKTFTLRMTEEEYSSFQAAMLKSKKKNQTDFFLECLNNKPIIVIENLKNILVELKRQGVNLNQIAKHFNEGGLMTEGIEDMMKNCNSAYKRLLDMEMTNNATL